MNAKTTDGTKSKAEASTKISSNSLASDLVRLPEFLDDNNTQDNLDITKTPIAPRTNPSIMSNFALSTSGSRALEPGGLTGVQPELLSAPGVK